MSKKLASLSSVADDVLADIAKLETVKTAKAEEDRLASLPPPSELGTLLHKLANDLREAPVEVTDEDLQNFLKGAL